MTRKTFELFGMDDERGVSPVIGVILMVAITVILAAVIGTFVLGLGENVSTSTPQAQLTLSAADDANTITIDHKGGDPIPAAEVEIKVTNTSDESQSFTLSPSTDATSEVTVGDSATIYANATTVNVTWPGGSDTTNDGASQIDLKPGTAYEVQIVHTESDQLILDRTVRP